jgi:hypothetical protein
MSPPIIIKDIHPFDLKLGALVQFREHTLLKGFDLNVIAITGQCKRRLFLVGVTAGIFRELDAGTTCLSSGLSFH